jgi:hypothetical protein
LPILFLKFSLQTFAFPDQSTGKTKKNNKQTTLAVAWVGLKPTKAIENNKNIIKIRKFLKLYTLKDLNQ